jgi:hypothetical protein
MAMATLDTTKTRILIRIPASKHHTGGTSRPRELLISMQSLLFGIVAGEVGLSQFPVL